MHGHTHPKSCKTLSFSRDPCGNHRITIWNTKAAIRITGRTQTTVSFKSLLQRT